MERSWFQEAISRIDAVNARDRRGYELPCAQRAGPILQEVGYPERTAARVQDLIRKRNFPRDPEMQFEETTGKTGADKMVSIIQKTWNKMTPQAREIALQMKMSAAQRALIEKAIQ